MTIRQATRNVLSVAQKEVLLAINNIASKYGLKVKAVPQYNSRYEAAMKVVVAIPKYDERLADERKIVLLTKQNPHQPGSRRAATFEAMKRSATVADFRARVAKSAGRLYPSYVAWAAQPHGDNPALIELR